MKKIFVVLLCCCMGLLTIACDATSLRAFYDDAAAPKEEKTEVGSKTEAEAEATTLSDLLLFAPSQALNADGDVGSIAVSSLVGYVELGTFPQTIAHHKAAAQMSLTTDATGYYVSAWDNEHYAKISKAKVYGKRFKFSDDALIKENELYYFKVEPIKWWVYVTTDATDTTVVTLISEQILDSHLFCDEYVESMLDQKYYRKDNPTVLANSWAYSDLRTWLNDEFLKKAFSPAEQKMLVARKTPGLADETEKVWVPSLPEMTAYQTLFAAIPLNRRGHYFSTTAQVSDYARCRDTFISIYPNYYGCGRYWTDTAGNKTYRTAYVPCDLHDSGASGETVSGSFMGVRPIIRLYTNDVTRLLKDDVDN